MTLREAISRVKKELKEVNADSRLTNKFVYSKLISKSSLLIQREADSLKLAKLQDMYQTLKCVEFKEVPAIDPHCSVKSDLVLYRSCSKLPDIYYDSAGAMFGGIMSLDRSIEMSLETLSFIINLREDTNSKFDKTIYLFFEDGYLYSEKPIKAIISGFFAYDISDYMGCDCTKEESPCNKFLDGKWFVPRKLEDSIISLTIQELANAYKRFPEQQIIDKNPNT